MPTQGELFEIGLREAAQAPCKGARKIMNLVRGDQEAREHARRVPQRRHQGDQRDDRRRAAHPAQPTDLQHRRFKFVRNSLEDFKEIKTLLDTTLNDVVLTVTSDALGRWLRSRYYPTDGLKLRALVPVSTRPKRKRGDDAAQGGNELLAMRGYLPGRRDGRRSSASTTSRTRWTA